MYGVEATGSIIITGDERTILILDSTLNFTRYYNEKDLEMSKTSSAIHKTNKNNRICRHHNRRKDTKRKHPTGRHYL